VRLTARLDELTELARLQLGHLTLHCEPIPITTLIESALGALDGVSRERVVVDDQAAAVVDVNKGQLRRVMVALLEAALARSPEESPVRLIITVNDPASVTLSIQDLADRQPILDEAVGILDQPERLDEFVDVQRRRWVPLALKMTLCRAWVERHGGRLWIAPGDDANASPGNTVCLSLPLAKRSPLTEASWPTSS
jgi:K+-sensing histidine kinase KdpD